MDLPCPGCLEMPGCATASANCGIAKAPYIERRHINAIEFGMRAHEFDRVGARKRARIQTIRTIGEAIGTELWRFLCCPAAAVLQQSCARYGTPLVASSSGRLPRSGSIMPRTPRFPGPPVPSRKGPAKSRPRVSQRSVLHRRGSKLAAYAAQAHPLHATRQAWRATRGALLHLAPAANAA